MPMFMTKVWGFSEPCAPLIFGEKGWRQNAINRMGQNQVVLVALVGTLRQPTREEDWGRLLGLIAVTQRPASSMDFNIPSQRADFDENGKYRWPYALEISDAWRFDQRPVFQEVVQRAFPGDRGNGIVALTPEEEAAILALPRRNVPILASAARVERECGLEEARRRGAPAPTDGARRGCMHLRRAVAQTYILSVENRTAPAWKIGWAFDAEQRMRHFNQHAMPALGGCNYTLYMRPHTWDTAKQAFRMEQAVLRHLDQYRHPQNREIIVGATENEVNSAWTAGAHAAWSGRKI